jgi:LysR family hydrogen peroxide-inducible transcriptional activator
MDSRQLEYFVAVAETEGFTAAARRCGVAQPSLSQQIAALERAVGQRLFDRLPRKTILTAAGAELLPRARAVLAAMSALDASAAAFDGVPRGQLAVAAAPTLAPFLLAEVAARFLAKFPSVTLAVREMPTDALRAAVRAGEVDVALVGTPVGDPTLLVEPLFSEKIVLALRYGHVLMRRREILPADLRKQTLIVLEDLHDVTGQLPTFLQAASAKPVLVSSGLQVATIEAMVAAGIGVCPLPAMARQHAKRGKAEIVFRPFAGSGPARTVSAMSNRDRFRTPAAHEFMNVLRGVISNFH